MVSASLRRGPFPSFNGATPVVSCFWLFRYVQSLFGLLVISPLMTSIIYVSCAFLTSCCVNFCRCLYLLKSFAFFDVFAFLCALLFLLASLLMFLLIQGLMNRLDVILDGTCFSIVFSQNVLNDVQTEFISVNVVSMIFFSYFWISSLMFDVSALSHLYIFRLTGLFLIGVNNVSVRTMSWSLLPRGGKGLHLFTRDGWDVNNKSKVLSFWVVKSTIWVSDRSSVRLIICWLTCCGKALPVMVLCGHCISGKLKYPPTMTTALLYLFLISSISLVRKF